MNFRTTLILLITLLAVGIAIVSTRNKTVAPPGDSSAPTVASSNKLFDINSSDINRVSFNDESGQQITLERQDFAWRLTAPVKGPADDSAVSSVLDAIANAQTHGLIDAGAGTGLDSPTHHVEFATKDGRTFRFDVGSRSGAGDNVYINRGGQTQADVVGASLADALDKSLKDYRQAKLFEIGAPQVKQLKIATTQGSMSLTKSGEDWKMNEPISEPADAFAVSDLASAAANLRADEFVSEDKLDLKKYGLDKPVMTVNLSTEAPVAMPSTAPTTAPVFTTITFGRYDDVLRKNVYAAVSTEPGIVKVSATVLNQLKKTPLEVRDKKVANIDPESITKILIHKVAAATTQPTTKPEMTTDTVLVRTPPAATQPASRPATTVAATTGPATTQAATTTPAPPKWTIASDGDKPADDGKVTALLTEFHPLRAETYRESFANTSPSESFTVTITTKDGEKDLSVVDPGKTGALQGSMDDLHFELARYLLDQLNADFSKSAAPAAPMRMPGMGGMPGMQP